MEPALPSLLATISPYITLVGFVIGLGAVTVIDLLGWLGRHSPYWTEATIRTHKVTKPLIWLGFLLVLFGGSLLLYSLSFPPLSWLFFVILLLLIINGFFLSFIVSPYLLSREQAGLANEPLPVTWQRNIIFSFIISFLGWWSSLIIVIRLISN